MWNIFVYKSKIGTGSFENLEDLNNSNPIQRQNNGEIAYDLDIIRPGKPGKYRNS